MTTLTKKKHIDQLHFEHQLWTSEAKFYSDELKIYHKRLEEVAAKNTKLEVRKQIEHFQNQFLIQNEELQKLTHDVSAHEHFLAKFSEQNPVAIDHRLFGDHAIILDKITDFKKIYDEVKIDFNRFLSNWM